MNNYIEGSSENYKIVFRTDPLRARNKVKLLFSGGALIGKNSFCDRP
jgi:hypothetical protein